MQFTRILAIRHGETAWNQETRLQGHLDIPLNDTGHRQAQRLGQALSGESIDAIYASDLSRARQTAQAIADVCQRPVQVTDTLRERCFGAFEGKTWAELETGWPEAARAWRQRVPDFAPAGGENLLQLQARIVSALNTLAQRHLGEQIVIVSHGGVMDVLYRAATRLDLQAPRTWQLHNAAINRLLWTPEGLHLVGWADTSHLDTDSRDEATAA